jgi:hypothetical protein
MSEDWEKWQRTTLFRPTEARLISPPGQMAELDRQLDSGEPSHASTTVDRAGKLQRVVPVTETYGFKRIDRR